MDELFDRIRKEFGISPRDIIFPTNYGPINLQNLTLLKGWIYDLYEIGFPGTEQPLTTGGPAVTLANYTDEKGWVLLYYAIFRSPYAQLNFSADNWRPSATPFMSNIIGPPQNEVQIYNTVYNPFTPYGPLYGLFFTPSYAIPYERRLSITLDLPRGIPIDETTIFKAGVGRIWLQDERLFLRSIKRQILEQMTGNRIERYP